jgi:hypothetical protein
MKMIDARGMKEENILICEWANKLNHLPGE